ncbi:bifunctional nicotinamidase/pyrazinamidase [Candidatus Borrarchaeum sp.]|uniref:bifunctional nicotinamidase/pyrazinamidase n=1 Tax=Candidatus Borrarchaeum sp. TaxID=2846742 RepID=UPI0025809E6B|nr:bifunctional nicotinamidase/pyrazinamidase [Candidatus Borrarchaeum sp.]
MQISDVKIKKDIEIQPNDALIIIDMQNDFMPSGALPVAEGDIIISDVNQLAEKFHNTGNCIVLTQDWHPTGHHSFASAHEGKEPYEPYSTEGIGPILWPDHCVQGTTGADFHPDLDTTFSNAIIHKGTNPKIDSYSAFLENDKKTETGLSGYLRTLGVKRIFVCGLALDYCVFSSAIDGKKLEFEVVFVIDLTKPVGAPEGIVSNVLEEMTKEGIIFTNSGEIQKHQ